MSAPTSSLRLLGRDALRLCELPTILHAGLSESLRASPSIGADIASRVGPITHIGDDFSALCARIESHHHTVAVR